MADIYETLLLLALPASGKSEVRTYLEAKDPESFHMGPTIQLDDYPYVHLQLLVDEALEQIGQPRVFHPPNEAPGQRNGPFFDPAELGGLVELLSEDFRELHAGTIEMPGRPAETLLERFDAASVRAGGKAKFAGMDADVLRRVAEIFEPGARKFYEQRTAELSVSPKGKTVVIEFARGGPKVDEMPLEEGYGYAGSLKYLDAELLESACILYIWVDPEESRRKNLARARPDGHGSILFHGTPETVMDTEYGACDMVWLMEQSDVPNTVRVERDGRVFHVPTAIFDNRTDLTTFLRKPQDEWTAEEIDAIHAGLKADCDRLWSVFKP